MGNHGSDYRVVLGGHAPQKIIVAPLAPKIYLKDKNAKKYR